MVAFAADLREETRASLDLKEEATGVAGSEGWRGRRGRRDRRSTVPAETDVGDKRVWEEASAIGVWVFGSATLGRCKQRWQRKLTE